MEKNRIETAIKPIRNIPSAIPVIFKDRIGFAKIKQIINPTIKIKIIIPISFSPYIISNIWSTWRDSDGNDYNEDGNLITK